MGIGFVQVNMSLRLSVPMENGPNFIINSRYMPWTLQMENLGAEVLLSITSFRLFWGKCILSGYMHW